MHDRTPYLYLLEWTAQNKKYIGVRYGKGCHPSDLWSTYFTSSAAVKQYREENGEPDEIKILRTFDTPLEAKNAEDEYLKEHDAGIDPRFLNIRGDSFKNLDVTKVRHLKGKDNPIHKYLASHREEFVKKVSEKTKAGQEKSQKAQDAFVVHRKRFIDHNPGKNKSDETKRLISEAKQGKPAPWLAGEKNGMFGKTQTAEARIAISKSASIARAKEVHICAICNREIRQNRNLISHFMKTHQMSHDEALSAMTESKANMRLSDLGNR